MPNVVKNVVRSLNTRRCELGRSPSGNPLASAMLLNMRLYCSIVAIRLLYQRMPQLHISRYTCSVMPPPFARRIQCAPEGSAKSACTGAGGNLACIVLASPVPLFKYADRSSCANGSGPVANRAFMTSSLNNFFMCEADALRSASLGPVQEWQRTHTFQSA